MFVLFVSVFGVQIPVILHEDDFKIAADQELLQLIFLLSLSHMSQDKLNKLKREKQKYKICCENPSQMENNFLNTVAITERYHYSMEKRFSSRKPALKNQFTTRNENVGDARDLKFLSTIDRRVDFSQFQAAFTLHRRNLNFCG